MAGAGAGGDRGINAAGLDDAIQALERGDKQGARRVLASLLHLDATNADAWRWMAIALDDPEKKRQCWQRVLHLRPGDRQAIEAMGGVSAPVVSKPKKRKLGPLAIIGIIIGSILLSIAGCFLLFYLIEQGVFDQILGGVVGAGSALLCLFAVSIPWIICGTMTARINRSRGRSGVSGFIGGFLLGPIGLVLALLTPKDRAGIARQEQKEEWQAIRRGEMRQCPYCAETVKAQARVCRYCGRDI